MVCYSLSLHVTLFSLLWFVKSSGILHLTHIVGLYVVGMLIEKALLSVFQSEKDFPYIVHLNSKIKSSDGYSTMISVCGGTHQYEWYTCDTFSIIYFSL